MIKVLIRNARAGAVDLAAAEQQRMDETAEQQRMDVAAAVAAKVISYATNLLNF